MLRITTAKIQITAFCAVLLFLVGCSPMAEVITERFVLPDESIVHVYNDGVDYQRQHFFLSDELDYFVENYQEHPKNLVILNRTALDILWTVVGLPECFGITRQNAAGFRTHAVVMRTGLLTNFIVKHEMQHLSERQP